MELDVKAEYERYKKQTTTDVFNEFKSKDKLLNLQNKTLENNLKLKTTDKENIRFNIKNKKIIKRFKLKDKKSRKVGVLIKNKKTRRLIDRDIRDLRKKN